VGLSSWPEADSLERPFLGASLDYGLYIISHVFFSGRQDCTMIYHVVVEELLVCLIIIITENRDHIHRISVAILIEYLLFARGEYYPVSSK
jgi:hypothetical protein